ncbi:MAG: class I SAM-dependent methyltransferase [Promethearchaeota archaeon]|nr:MAG: class I SAM-dependent methyltransferase [Candidatus Lokiarchaeota archaeon]
MNDDYHFKVKKQRPEEIYDEVTDYFKAETLINYANSKTIARIQQKITLRALELMDIPNKNSLLLDAGCGPGFAALFLEEMGYNVVCLDLIPKFLLFYDLMIVNPLAGDMRLIPFRENSFDGIISISALQWIFKNKNDQVMKKDLIKLIKNFYTILNLGSKVVFQFYPKNSEILKEIGKIVSENTSFTGNFIIDFPDNPKKRRIFLILKKD